MHSSDAVPELDRIQLGKKLLELRKIRGLSLRSAAEMAGLSSGFISLVERGMTSIAVSRLIRLADAYGVEIADLLSSQLSSESRVDFGPSYVPHASASVLRPAEKDVEVHYIPAPPWMAQPFIVRMNAGARLEELHHHGHEFVHCTGGEPTVTIEGVSHVLGIGDTVFIESGTFHEYSNDSSSPATLLGASMPRTLAGAQPESS